MKRVLPKHTGDKVEGRANSKGATINGRHYVIGGLSQQGPETSIHSFVIVGKQPYVVEWRKQDVENVELFTLRHSFAVAEDGVNIYIFGGDRIDTGESIGELLKYDTQKNSLSKVETGGERPPPMNSMTLGYNSVRKELVLFGGVNQSEKIPLGLYHLNLDSSTWRFQSLHLECYDQGIWQHTAHLVPKPLTLGSNDKVNSKSKAQKIIGLDLGFKENEEKTLAHKIAKINLGEQQSLEKEGEVIETTPVLQGKYENKQPKQQTPMDLSNQKGPVLVIVGGCFHPNHPYSEITQLDIGTGAIISQSFVSPITGHESVLYRDRLFVFGGSDGTAATEGITIVGEEIKEEKGFSGIGPAGFTGENEVIIFGGVNVSTNPPSFNKILILYEE